MTIAIFGTNGMLSSYLSKYFFKDKKNTVVLFGLEQPSDNSFAHYKNIDLLKDEIDYKTLMDADLIIYASGAGVQASQKTESDIIFSLNLEVPVNICNSLKDNKYNGIFISFGSYMEIGINNDEDIFFDERQVELSEFPVTNDYALSKRLFTRFIGSFNAPFKFWHFILPNIFLKDETGTRLIPYVLDYLKRIRNGEVCDFPKFSHGNQIRQYIHFEDVCYSINNCINKDIPAGIYNIGGGEILRIREIIIRLFDYYGVPLREEMFGKEFRHDGDIRSLKLNGEKLKNKIGYIPHQVIESIL